MAAITRSLRCYSTKKLTLSMACPHSVIFNKTEVRQVNLNSSDGSMGILADHVPTMAQLKPGVIDIFGQDDKNTKLFVSGGFAVMNPDSTLNISALEAFPLDQLDGDAARKAVTETTSKIASATNEQEKATLKAELEVYEAVATATK